MPTKSGNSANFLRLSGQGVFFTAGSTAGISLGNIVMHKKTTKVTTKEHYSSRGGRKILDRSDVIQLEGEYEVDVDEAFTENLPILLFADKATVVDQAAVAAPTGTISLAGILLNQTYDLGARKLVTVVVKKGATTLVGDTLEEPDPTADYRLNADTGMITFYGGGTNTLTDANDIGVTYGCAALSRESYVPFSVPQRKGTLLLFEDDGLTEAGAGFRIEKRIPCNLSADGTDETKAEDFTKWTLKAKVTGPMVELREPRAVAGF